MNVSRLCPQQTSVPLCCTCPVCSEGIVRWVKKKSGPAAADLADKAALTAAEKEAEVIVLGYFTEAKVGWLGPPPCLGAG